MNFIIGFVVGVLVTAFVPDLGLIAIEYVNSAVEFMRKNA